MTFVFNTAYTVMAMRHVPRATTTKYRYTVMIFNCYCHNIYAPCRYTFIIIDCLCNHVRRRGLAPRYNRLRLPPMLQRAPLHKYMAYRLAVILNISIKCQNVTLAPYYLYCSYKMYFSWLAVALCIIATIARHRSNLSYVLVKH